MFDYQNILSLTQKIFAILGAAIYLVFAFVMIKQVASMSHNVHDKFNAVIKIFSYLHFIFSLFVLFLAIFLL